MQYTLEVQPTLDISATQKEKVDTTGERTGIEVATPDRRSRRTGRDLGIGTLRVSPLEGKKGRVNIGSNSSLDPGAVVPLLPLEVRISSAVRLGERESKERSKVTWHFKETVT